jgi:hypothetical protein
MKRVSTTSCYGVFPVKKYYFVGGPKTGQSEEFFRRLNQVGGTPPGWRVYPHVVGDDKALHVVDVESEEEVFKHLQHFHDIYEWGEIVEITETRQ